MHGSAGSPALRRSGVRSAPPLLDIPGPAKAGHYVEKTLKPDTTSINRVGAYRPLQRRRAPPLTRRGVPIVVGSVPTKYCRSKTFSTPKKTSRLRPMDRWAEKSTTLYLGSPASVDATYPASLSAAAGTTREF